jgi:hypothetical protein
MIVSVTSHTLYHSQLLSYFSFVLEFNMWHRIGWVHLRFFCCSIFSFLCSALHAIACFFSFCLVIPFGIFWLPLRYFLISPFVPSDNSLMSSNYSFVSFPWLPRWYLLITPLVSFDHSVGIFRSLLWYHLFTPLVSSDNAFGIFWLPIWYLLITPLVSSDYVFGIFWLPIWYLLITSLVSFDCVFGIFW